jgi:hypothetical protein
MTGWDWDSRDDGRRYTAARPYSKEAQLGVGRPKARGRKKASASTWRELHARKNGPCRLCEKPGPSHLHHLLSKARGGRMRRGICVHCARTVICSSPAKTPPPS